MEGTPMDKEYTTRKKLNLTDRNPCGYEISVINTPIRIGNTTFQMENLKTLFIRLKFQS